MNGKNRSPQWVLWIMEHGVRILILLALAFMAFVYTRSRTNTEERLGAIEARVRVRPPRAYQPPDLSQFDAGNIDTSTLGVHQAVYVPVYSHIYYDGGRPYLLETTLSIRNVDPNAPIYISKADYFDTDGTLAEEELDRLIRLKPLQTIEFLIERHKLHRRVACREHEGARPSGRGGHGRALGNERDLLRPQERAPAPVEDGLISVRAFDRRR